MDPLKPIRKDSTVIASICYLSWFLGLGILTPLVVYMLGGKDRFLRFHALQSLLLSVVLSILGVIGIVMSILTIGVGFLVILLMSPILIPLFLFVVVLYLYLSYSSFKGGTYLLPWIGKFALECV